jgi:uncharacterized Tic20 family protein
MEPVPDNVSSDEKLWAMLAHLFGLAGYFGGVGQYVAPLVIYLLYKDKSRFVAFHALQSLYFQLAVLVALMVSFALMVVLIGIPMLAFVGVGSLIYVIVAAIRAYNGELFEYWLVGKWARQTVGI